MKKMSSEIVPAVGVLIFKDDSVLLVKHEEGAGHLTGTWALPSGRLNEGESEKKAAVRELEEEAGLTASEEDLLEYAHNSYFGHFPRKDGSEMYSSLKVFICQKYSGGLNPSAETTPYWIERAGLIKIRANLLPNVETIINDGLKFLSHNNQKERKL